MKQYDSYKESGVEWIGKVPSHWEIMPLKFTGTFGNGLTYSPKDVVDNGILVLRSSNIQNSSLSFEDNVYVSNVSKVLLVQKGDVIICSRNGSAALVGKSAFIDKDINATFGAFMMRYIPKINKKYGFYLFQTAIGRYKGYFATTTINQLTKSTIGEMKVPLANTEEQTAIVDFLDNKCSEIDKVISAQQKRIALLQELKQSVITHAVTKGLNPNVEMKDSGVEWIGKSPLSWKYCRLKDFLKLRTDVSESLVKIGLENIESKTGKFIETSTEFEGNGVAFSKRNIVYGKLRPYLQKVWLAEFDGNAVGDFFVFESKKNAIPTFIKYLMLSDGFTKEADGSTVGAKMPRVSSSFILTMHYCLPSIEEQQAIVEYLTKRCDSLDIALSKAQYQVELLQEYKQSLITEVVTGKRKVC